MKQTKEVRIALAMILLTTLTANLVHPVTPKFIEMRGVHNYMFGVAFACMAIATFLTSTFWGNLSDRIGRKKVMFVTFLFYALGQYLFLCATSEVGIAVARFIGGIGGGGLSVIQLAYLTDVSSNEKKGSNLVVAGAMTAVVSSFGFLIGGVLGDVVGIEFVFMMQVVGLTTLGCLTYFLPEHREKKELVLRDVMKESSPFASVQQAKNLKETYMLLFFVTVFLTSYASVCFDQSYNFYLRSELGFPTSYNGYIKAAIGILGLIANGLIGKRIVRSKDLSKGYFWIVVCCTVLNGLMLLMGNLVSFLVVSLVYFLVYSLQIPLQQALLASSSEDGGKLFGLFQTSRSLGWIFGGLVSGFLYEIYARLPFINSTLIALIAALLIAKMRKRK